MNHNGNESNAREPRGAVRVEKDRLHGGKP
jgi:hypothetical protein